MSLNLESLVEGVINDLDRTRLVLLLGTATDTTEESTPVVHDNDLLEASSLLEFHIALAVMDLS